MHGVWTRIAGIGALALLVVACERGSSEPERRLEQRLEEVDADAPDAVALGESDAGAEAGAPACEHPICATGVQLDGGCDPCATSVCSVDPYCCTTGWDATCVSEVLSVCGQTCTAAPPGDGGASTCAHPVCTAGNALVSGCDPCTTQLCAQDPYCCGVAWDATCVGEVGTICGQSCN